MSIDLTMPRESRLLRLPPACCRRHDGRDDSANLFLHPGETGLGAWIMEAWPAEDDAARGLWSFVAPDVGLLIAFAR